MEKEPENDVFDEEDDVDIDDEFEDEDEEFNDDGNISEWNKTYYFSPVFTDNQVPEYLLC